MPTPSRRLTRLLFAALAGTAATFVITVAVVQWSASGIHAAAREIAENASPSVKELAGARSELHQFEVRLENYLEDASRGQADPSELRNLDATRERLAASWRRYLALPTFRGEEALRQPMTNAVEELTAITTAAALDANLPAVSLARAKATADQIDGHMERLQRFNGDQAVRLSVEIGNAWKLSLLLSGLFVLLSLILTAITFVIGRRLVRQNTWMLEQRAEELEQFAGRIAHDIVSPLSALPMTLSLIQEEPHIDPRVRVMIERGVQTVRRVRELVEALYRFAQAGGRPESLARTRVPESIRAALEELQASAETHRVLLLPEEIPPCTVACSPGVFQSLMSNLVGNAIKHMADSELREVRVRVRLEDRYVRVEIEDTGPGICPNLSPVVFDPYKRGETQTSGMGLGLATVKRLAESYHGTVGLSSEPGKGSVFWFRLPRSVDG